MGFKELLGRVEQLATKGLSQKQIHALASVKHGGMLKNKIFGIRGVL